MGCDYIGYETRLQIMKDENPEKYGDYTVLDFFLEEISEGRIPDFNYINWIDFIQFYVDLEPKSDGTGILANPIPKLEPFVDKIKNKEQRLNLLNYFYYNDNNDVFGYLPVDDATRFKEECSRLARKYGEKISIRKKLNLLEIAEAINSKRYYNIKHFLCYGIKWQEIKPEYIIPVINIRSFADSIKDDVVRLEVLKFLRYQGDRFFHDVSDAHGVTASMADYLAELDRLIKLNEYALRREQYCTYSVPNAAKSRDEIEADLERASQKSASILCNLLRSYSEDSKYLDFRGEPLSEVYKYLKDRYGFTYTEGQFTRNFNQKNPDK